MIYNPTRVNFTHPSQFTDGTPFGPADYAGTEFGYAVAGGPIVPTVAVPVAFGDGTGEVLLSALDLPRDQPFVLHARTVAANGTASVWTNPTDEIRFDVRVPNAPSAVVVS